MENKEQTYRSPNPQQRQESHGDQIKQHYPSRSSQSRQSQAQTQDIFHEHQHQQCKLRLSRGSSQQGIAQ